MSHLGHRSFQIIRPCNFPYTPVSKQRLVVIYRQIVHLNINGMMDKKNTFRRNLISRLPDINKIFDGINRRERKSVNDAVSDFVNVINEVASPLFKRQVNIESMCTFGVNHSTRSKWFDDECREKKIECINALRTIKVVICGKYINLNKIIKI